jgi:excisionase family DNA binding protein
MQQTFPNQEELVYTVNEASKALKVSRNSIYRLIKSGQLEKLKFGKTARITGASVRRLVSPGE